jgi:hypothetical protein
MWAMIWRSTIEHGAFGLAIAVFACGPEPAEDGSKAQRTAPLATTSYDRWDVAEVGDAGVALEMPNAKDAEAREAVADPSRPAGGIGVKGLGGRRYDDAGATGLTTAELAELAVLTNAQRERRKEMLTAALADPKGVISPRRSDALAHSGKGSQLERVEKLQAYLASLRTNRGPTRTE